MRKPSKVPSGRTYTISCTDEQWAAITDGAVKAGMKVSPWFVECTLNVDPWPRNHRRLVLDEREQRRHARAVAASARNLGADEAGGAGDVGADLTALMAARLPRDGPAGPARGRAGPAAPGIRRRNGANRRRRVHAGRAGGCVRGAGEEPGTGWGRGAAGAAAAGQPVPYRRRLGSALVCCIRRLRASGRGERSGESSPRSTARPRGRRPVRRMRHVSGLC